MKKLRSIDLHNNDLTGTIPSCLGNLTNYVSFQLHNNYLRGRLPDFQEASQLMVLALHGNMLTGHIPESYGELTSIQVFMCIIVWIYTIL